MTKPVDLYDSHHGNATASVYRDVRAGTFDEDLGQTSWITAAECDDFARRLGLAPRQDLLEVACGTGGTTVRLAERSGAAAIGIDANAAAIAAAGERAGGSDAAARLQFRVADADEPLPFPDRSFDALFCNDAINHFRDRARVLADWHRVLRPGGRCLYTDPIVVTGCLSSVEIAARSSIGHFLFTPLGRNESLLREARFRVTAVLDVTEGVAVTSKRWLDARVRHRDRLLALEGLARFDAFQAFLQMVHTLAAERRLSRYCFVAEK